MAEYEGTKIQDIDTIPPEVTLEEAKFLVVTSTGQYLVSFNNLVKQISDKINQSTTSVGA